MENCKLGLLNCKIAKIGFLKKVLRDAKSSLFIVHFLFHPYPVAFMKIGGGNETKTQGNFTQIRGYVALAFCQISKIPDRRCAQNLQTWKGLGAHETPRTHANSFPRARALFLRPKKVHFSSLDCFCSAF